MVPEQSRPSTDTLVAASASVIDVPKAAPPDSFVLHAPLELLARAILLHRAPDEVLDLGHERLRRLTDTYAAAGAATEVDLTEATGLPSVDELALGLAGAGHAPILLNLRPRVPAVPPRFGERLFATELARHPDWNLSWPRQRHPDPEPADLAERLAAPPSPGPPTSSSVYPTMHLVDSSGLAAATLDGAVRGLTVQGGREILLRAAARSMLQDDPAAAPYGWTHCLTLPQGILALADRGADPDVVLAAAATHVLGFRATLGRLRLEAGWTPAPGSAARRAWHAGDAELGSIEDELVAYACVHPDAHLAKYTLACLDAAEADPEERRLYLAAASHLHEWWQALPEVEDPILRRWTSR